MRAVSIVVLAYSGGMIQGPIGSESWWLSLPVLAVAAWMAAGLQADAERKALRGGA